MGHSNDCGDEWLACCCTYSHTCFIRAYSSRACASGRRVCVQQGWRHLPGTAIRAVSSNSSRDDGSYLSGFFCSYPGHGVDAAAARQLVRVRMAGRASVGWPGLRLGSLDGPGFSIKTEPAQRSLYPSVRSGVHQAGSGNVLELLVWWLARAHSQGCHVECAACVGLVCVLAGVSVLL